VVSSFFSFAASRRKKSSSYQPSFGALQYRSRQTLWRATADILTKRIQFCRIARGSVFEVRDHLIAARDQGYLTASSIVMPILYASA
jgi:hypothetical protein